MMQAIRNFATTTATTQPCAASACAKLRGYCAMNNNLRSITSSISTRKSNIIQQISTMNCQQRTFSSDNGTSSTGSSVNTQAIPKLKAVFEQYRRENFSQTIPPRFHKEVVHAADKNKDGMISVEEIETLLDNIGASERLTHEEVEHCMKEAGVSGDVLEIPVKQFTDILK